MTSVASLGRFTEPAWRGGDLSAPTARAYLRGWARLAAACTIEGSSLDLMDADRSKAWWRRWTDNSGASSQMQLAAALRLGLMRRPFRRCLEVRWANPTNNLFPFMAGFRKKTSSPNSSCRDPGYEGFASSCAQDRQK